MWYDFHQYHPPIIISLSAVLVIAVIVVAEVITAVVFGGGGNTEFVTVVLKVSQTHLGRVEGGPLVPGNLLQTLRCISVMIIGCTSRGVKKAAKT